MIFFVCASRNLFGQCFTELFACLLIGKKDLMYILRYYTHYAVSIQSCFNF